MTQVSNSLLHENILKDFEYVLLMIFPLICVLETQGKLFR
jgi:hypothetical protein